MSALLTVRVPDIGDFKDVTIAEVLIAPGTPITADAPLVLLKTDKATLEVPCPFDGVVERVSVCAGDKVSAGSPIAVIAAPAAAPTDSAAEPTEPEQAPIAATAVSSAAATETHDLVVIGGGPGGYSAAFRAADLGLDVVLVERDERLGGVCLNVGCISSKALLHLTGVIDEARAASRHGIAFGEPTIDLDAMRSWTDDIVRRLTDGLAGMARGRKVKVVRGEARFTSPQTLQVAEGGAAPPASITFKHCILAVGSRPVHLPFLPDDPRVVDSTGALALPVRPDRMLVIGGGIVGLEMATVYAALGAAVDVVELADHLMPGADRDLVDVWTAANRERLNRVMLSTRAIEVEARDDGLWARFDGANAPAEPERYDLVLQAAGRIANGDRIGAEQAGLSVERGGTISVDKEMRTSVPHILAIGDVAGVPMLAHKAVHEGHVAAEVAAGRRAALDTNVIPSVAYTRPEVAWVGETEASAAATGRIVRVGRFPWAASGRALVSDAAQGVTKLLFDGETGRVIGGGIVGAHAGDLIAEVVLAIEMGADAVDIGRTIHPHPTLAETVGLSADVEEGVCTDLPPDRRTGSAPTRMAAE